MSPEQNTEILTSSHPVLTTTELHQSVQDKMSVKPQCSELGMWVSPHRNSEGTSAYFPSYIHPPGLLNTVFLICMDTNKLGRFKAPDLALGTTVTGMVPSPPLLPQASRWRREARMFSLPGTFLNF